MGGSSSNTSFNYDGQLSADKELQTIEVGEDVKGETKARRNKKYPDLIKYPFPEEKGGIKTVWDAFQRGVAKFPESKMYGTRMWEYDEKSGKYVKGSDGSEKRGKYVWETYKQIDKSVRGLGSGLVELKAKAGDNIGIWAVNRTEWMVASLATYSQNMRTVSLYATLGEDAVEYIVNHADIPIVVTEKENMKKLIHMLPKITGVKTIIQMDVNPLYGNGADKVDEADVKACAEAKVQLIGFSEVIKLGEAKQNFPVPPDEKDLAFIMYTSGTTGQPKGAMLSHGNLMATVASVPLTIPLKETDVHISYLPLAHIFETIVQVSLLINGGAIGYFQGNVKKLTNDFCDLEPTIVCGVPRVYGRIYQRVFSGVAEKNCIARYFFAKYYAAQCNNIRAGRERDATADKKVFIPLRNKIGLGKTRLMITGAAPCPPYLMEFLKVVTGAMVVQGYGLTETSAATNVTLPTDRNVGHVGPPLPSTEIKLRDVPEMNYLATDTPCPRGEVLVRGANVFQGYFKNEKATTECLDQKDGWFSTGDIGRWNPNGTLSIIDRKKNIFKLSQGEYIAAEKIELVYAKAPTVGQIWVYGNSYKSFVLAVVVPAADVIAKHCVTQGWWPSTEAPQPGTEKFAQDFLKVWEGPHKAALKDHVVNTMREYEKELKGFEIVKDVLIEYKIDNMLAGFTEANECLTPTFKLRRPYLLKRYKDALKDLYEKHGEPNKADEKWPGEP